ncbi:MAG: hypothetical protein CSB47_10060 [Proteobacteria bacterium]|nr:MAG: hypothetical protein CSB47_10060 [Pseudomonadota bacterium]
MANPTLLGMITGFFTNARTTPVVLIILLSAISFYTSYDGLVRFSFATPEEASLVSLIVLGLVVFCIQLVLVYALRKMALSRRWMAKVRWLPLYMLMMSISVFFSYGFYYKLLRAEGFAQENFTAQLNQVRDGAQDYLLAFEAVERGSKQLKLYSERRAREEEKFGGSCGDGSVPGKGPRRTFRNNEALVFSAIAKSIEPLGQQVRRDIGQLQNIIENYRPDTQDVMSLQNEINGIIHEINTRRNAPVLAESSRVIAQRVGEKRQRIVPTAAGSIPCPDSTITLNGNAMLKSIEFLPFMEDVQLFNPFDQRNVLNRAMDVIRSIPGLAVAWWKNEDLKPLMEHGKDSTRRDDYVPLLLGALVDFVLLIVGLADGYISRRRNWMSADFEGDYFSAEDVSKLRAITDMKHLASNVQPYLYDSLGQCFFVIPSSPVHGNRMASELLELFEVLASERIKPAMLRQVPYAWIPRSVRNEVYAILGDDAEHLTYNVYRMSAMQWDELKQALSMAVVPAGEPEESDAPCTWPY